MPLTSTTGSKRELGKNAAPAGRPTYSISRDPLGNNALTFDPPAGSQELEEALVWEFPPGPVLTNQYRAATERFLVAENAQKGISLVEGSERRYSPSNLDGATSTPVDASTPSRPLTRTSTTASERSAPKVGSRPRGRQSGKLSQEASRLAALKRKFDIACAKHRRRKGHVSTTVWASYSGRPLSRSPGACGSGFAEHMNTYS